MMQLSLKPRPGKASTTSSATLIDGLTSAELVAVLVQEVKDQEALRLLVVPGPMGQATSWFCISTCTESFDLGIGLRYRLLADHIYVPLHSDLDAHLSVTEAEQLLDGRQLITHPVREWLLVDAGDWRRLDEIMGMPPIAIDSVQRPPDTKNPPPLRQLSVVGMPPPSTMFTGEGSDIGQDSPEQLKQASSDETGPAGSAWLQAQKGLAGLAGGAARWLMDIGGKIGDKKGNNKGVKPNKGLMQGIADWAAQRRDGINKHLDNMRHKEIHRLLDLLRKDPDKGLRYALPLGQSGGSGKAAPPNARLGERQVDFRMGGWHQTGDGTAWDVDGRLQEELRNSYLEAARREEGLGRHRRAAYIYAHLLYDFRLAAQVLERGGYFLEAAQVYEEHCLDRLKAANCLLRCGQFATAAVHFEELKRHAAAARAWMQAGDPEASQRCWETKIRKLLHDGNLIRAVDIVHDELGDIQRHLHMLYEAWPHHAQSIDALTRELDWYLANEQTETGIKRVRRLLRSQHKHEDLQVQSNLLTVLQRSQLLQAAPSQTRQELLDQLRQTTATCIVSDQGQDRMGLLTQLSTIDDADVLMKRDCRRYQRNHPEFAPNSDTVIGEEVGQQLQLEMVSSFHLPEQGQWVWAWGSPRALTAIGAAKDGSVLLTRRVWPPVPNMFDAFTQSSNEQYIHHADRQLSPLVFPNSIGTEHSWYLDTSSSDRQEPLILPATDSFADLRFESSQMLPSNDGPPLLAHDAEGSVWICRREGPHLQIECWQYGKDLVYTTIVHELQDARPLFALADTGPCLAAGNSLMLATAGADLDDDTPRIKLPGTAHAMIGSPRKALPRVIVATDAGMFLAWRDTGRWSHTRFAQDLCHAKMALIGNGTIIVADTQQGGRIYQRKGDRVIRRGSWDPPTEPVQHIVQGADQRSFAVVTDSGLVQTYRMPKVV